MQQHRPIATDGCENGGEIRAIDLLGALSIMADMSLGLVAGHGVRSAYIAMRIARQLRLSNDEQADLFYTALLTDAGCTAWASQAASVILGDDMQSRRDLFFFTDPTDPRDLMKWLVRYMAAGERIGVRLRRALDFAVRGRQFMMEALRNSSEVAARFAGRLDRSPGVQNALRFAFERWDGSGPGGRRRDSIPLISRITYASIFLEVFHGVNGRNAAVDLAMARRGSDLDPAVVDAFLGLARDEAFWSGLESDAIWTIVPAMEPDSAFRYFDVSRLDDAAAAFGDFADLKSSYAAGHCRRVAAWSESIARTMAFSERAIADVRRAGLLHDIGLVTVPSFILHKPEERVTQAEHELIRLHPYYGDRILSRARAFSAQRTIVAAHHERPDGGGYYRGLAGGEIDAGAQMVAVADRFDELTHRRPGREALPVDAALDALNRDAGSAFSAESFAALRECLARAAMEPAVTEDALEARVQREPAAGLPAGLTPREVEVLRILSTGASRRDMADRLSVSEHTVRHHLEHIYAKIGVRTRVEATLFAIEHALVS